MVFIAYGIFTQTNENPEKIKGNLSAKRSTLKNKPSDPRFPLSCFNPSSK
jgi:hypothetical protein